MSCVLFAQCTVDNLSLANAAWDKCWGGSAEIHASNPRLLLQPPALGLQPFVWAVGAAGAKGSGGKGGCVYLLLGQMSICLLCCLQAGHSLGWDEV